MCLVSGDTVFEIHNPDPGDLKQMENDNSLVVSLKKRIHDDLVYCSLFTGDIEEESMRSLMNDMKGITGPIVLEAPHHGSIRKSSSEFIKNINPKIIIQSTGLMRMRKNRLSGIVKKNPDIKLVSTALHGAVQVDFLDCGSVEIKTHSVRDE